MEDVNEKNNEDFVRQMSFRRSTRIPVKPKRYEQEESISYKRIKTSSKPNTPKQKQHIDNNQMHPIVVMKEHKVQKTTPKTTSKKTLFGSNKSNNHKRMQDMLKEFTLQRKKKKLSLSLNDMSIDEVMATFELIKSKLCILFQEICHIDYVKKYGDIDHYLVIDLLPHHIQSAMMNKLSDLFETEKSPKYATHFVNVLMPEWILGIFMNRFNMNREQSIAYIKEQRNFVYDWQDKDDDV